MKERKHAVAKVKKKKKSNKGTTDGKDKRMKERTSDREREKGCRNSKNK